MKKTLLVILLVLLSLMSSLGMAFADTLEKPSITAPVKPSKPIVPITDSKEEVKSGNPNDTSQTKTNVIQNNSTGDAVNKVVPKEESSKKKENQTTEPNIVVPSKDSDGKNNELENRAYSRKTTKEKPDLDSGAKQNFVILSGEFKGGILKSENTVPGKGMPVIITKDGKDTYIELSDTNEYIYTTYDKAEEPVIESKKKEEPTKDEEQKKTKSKTMEAIKSSILFIATVFGIFYFIKYRVPKNKKK